MLSYYGVLNSYGYKHNYFIGRYVVWLIVMYAQSRVEKSEFIKKIFAVYNIYGRKVKQKFFWQDIETILRMQSIVCCFLIT